MTTTDSAARLTRFTADQLEDAGDVLLMVAAQMRLARSQETLTHLQAEDAQLAEHEATLRDHAQLLEADKAHYAGIIQAGWGTPPVSLPTVAPLPEPEPEPDPEPVESLPEPEPLPVPAWLRQTPPESASPVDALLGSRAEPTAIPVVEPALEAAIEEPAAALAGTSPAPFPEALPTTEEPTTERRRVVRRDPVS